MYSHWYVVLNSSDYYFAREEVDGFDFYFTKDEFDIFNSNKIIYEMLSYDLFFRNVDFEAFGYNVTEFNEYIWNYPRVDIPPEFLHIYPWDDWSEFPKIKLVEIQQQISANLIIIAELEGNASFYSFGVTLIMISTILATAMAAQLNDKERDKEFSLVKAKIYEDNTMIIEKENRFAMLVLILAFLLSALGLLIPIIYGFIF